MPVWTNTSLFLICASVSGLRERGRAGWRPFGTIEKVLFEQQIIVLNTAANSSESSRVDRALGLAVNANCLGWVSILSLAGILSGCEVGWLLNGAISLVNYAWPCRSHFSEVRHSIHVSNQNIISPHPQLLSPRRGESKCSGVREQKIEAPGQPVTSLRLEFPLVVDYAPAVSRYGSWPISCCIS